MRFSFFLLAARVGRGVVSLPLAHLSSTPPQAFLLFAALLTLAQAPYTALTLLPKALQLEKIEKEIQASPEENNARDTDSGVLEYKALFWGRVALVGPAFVLAVVELVLA